MKPVFKISFILISVLFFTACKRTEDLIPDKIDAGISLNLTINYKVDGAALIFDSLLYTNNAGNNYKVTRLEYYISNITFHSTSSKDFSPGKIFYVNAQTPSTNNIIIDNIPEGQYDYITLHIGIDTATNSSYSLPNTNENINMAWPDYMGGGYHFMKFEGNYMYLSSQIGFSVHLGQNSSLVSCRINNPFIITSSSSEIKLSMNLNEWFRSPINYDFNIDGYATMGDKQARGKIAANGIDVFTME